MASKTGNGKTKMPSEYIEWLIRRLVGAKEPFTDQPSRIDTHEIPKQASNDSEAPHPTPLPYLECIYLQEVYGGGYLVNRTVKITRDHWNGIMNGKCSSKGMYCALCKCEFNRNTGHMKTPTHESVLRDCPVLREFGYALIRKVDSDENHCAICNTVFRDADTASHLASENHVSLFRGATEPVSQLLKKWGKLHKLHKFSVTESDTIKFNKTETHQDVFDSTLTQTASEASVANDQTNPGSDETETEKCEKPNGIEPDPVKSKFLTIKSVFKVVGGGLIVNNEVLIGMQSWNTYMGPAANIFCHVCQVQTKGLNGYRHTKDMRHEENLKKYYFLKDYRLDLIRRLSNSKFHCGICADVVDVAATHVATQRHLKNFLASLEAATESLQDINKCINVDLDNVTTDIGAVL